jgi:SAM-dependent methyltransferase
MRLLRQLMRVEAIRAWVLGARYIFFAKILRRLMVFQNPSAGVSADTVSYNLTAFDRLVPLVLRRTNILLRTLSSIETLAPESAILVIGPRTEDDLLHLSAYGFSNVRGFDLISYSPLIDVGDMHQLPYADSSFDAVLYGWVLAYSDDPERAAREGIRVVKNGGIIGIGAEHYPSNPPDTPFDTAEKHLDLFRGHVKQVFFIHDVGSQIRDRMSNTCVIFAAKKN